MAEEQNKKEWRAEIPEDDDYEEERLRRKWEREQEMKQTQRERRLREQKRKLRAIMILAVSAAILIVVIVVLTVNVFIPLARYHQANRYLENGEYAAAIDAFRLMPGYRDADTLLDEAIRLQAVTLSGRDDVLYETSSSAPWFSITESGVLDFDEDLYTGDMNITIPDVFDGVLVETLSEKIFAHSDLLSIEISDCVTVIEDMAFLGCEDLVTLELPAHLISVGDSAFEGCTSLTSVVFPTTLESVGVSAFAKCRSLRTVELPSSLVTLNSRAFNACTELSSVTLGGEALKTIGSYAFSACEALETFRFRGTAADWSALVSDNAKIGLENVTVSCSDTAE